MDGSAKTRCQSQHELDFKLVIFHPPYRRHLSETYRYSKKSEIMLDEQSKALPQFDGLPYGNQPPTRTTRTTTPQTFLELEVHLKRYQVHLYSDTPTPLSLLNSRFHHHCLSIKPGSMSFWHIFFVISPHFEKKRFHFFFFLPANDSIYVYDTAQERQYIAQERQYIRSG